VERSQTTALRRRRPACTRARATAALLAVLALVAAWPAAAPARSVLSRTFRQLVTDAEVIVVARVADARPRRVSRGLIVTDFALDAVQVVQGDAGRASPLTLPGGRVGGEGLQFSGVPQLAVGERYLIFLGKNPRAFVPVVGAGQGVLRVAVDPADGTELVHDAGGGPLDTETVAQIAEAAGVPIAGARVPLSVALLAIDRILAP
jgi:hypothetical protein